MTFPKFQTNYDNHIRSKHTGERPFKCKVPNCGKSFTAAMNLVSHRKVHFKQVECSICNRMVKNLPKHLKTHEDKSMRPTVICTYEEPDGTVCGKELTTSVSLARHLESYHRGVKKFSCDQCDAIFAKGQSLKFHIQKVHQKIKIKCELCSTLVTRKDYYIRHIKLNHPEMSSEVREAFIKKIRNTKSEDLIYCSV